MTNFLSVFAIIFFTAQSQALIEVRAGYGTQTLDEESYAGADFGQLKGFNLDAIFEPPLITDLGFGLRYEMLSMEHEGVNADLDMDRLSLLINYRVIDFVAFLGFIGTYALTNTAEYKAGGATVNFDEKATYTLGVEGGVNLGIFSIGAEIGKMFGKLEHPSNGSEIKLDSMYAKVLFGIGF